VRLGGSGQEPDEHLGGSGVAVREFPLLPMTSSASSKLGRKRCFDRVEAAMGKLIARDIPQPQVEDFGDHEEDDTVEEELVA
jgi:hypothetical protein